MSKGTICNRKFNILRMLICIRFHVRLRGSWLRRMGIPRQWLLLLELLDVDLLLLLLIAIDIVMHFLLLGIPMLLLLRL